MGVAHHPMAKTIVADVHFEPVGWSALARRSRVTVSTAVEKLRSVLGDTDLSGLQLSVAINDAGQILLTPELRVPAHEVWLPPSPTLLAQVREGIAQAGRGEARTIGSFAEFAEEDLGGD